MIKIDKSNNIPSILKNEGAAETQRNCNDYDSNPNKYTTQNNVNNIKPKKFDFYNKIYGHSDVKAQLKKEQNNKCCFCEAIFDANSYGDVEHFRPKAAYKLGGKLIYPAYYWLAYDWNNLMFSCQICNQKFKGNEFPVLDENTRVKKHNDTNSISNEKHTLINPIEEDPENFIFFNFEIPKPKSTLNPVEKIRASETIRIFGIDRKELNRDRLEYLKILKILKIFLNYDINNQSDINDAIIKFKLPENEIRENINNAKQIYANAAKKISKFAGMVRSNFPNLPKN